MAEVLFFHNALGLTAGCVGLADELRGAGHTVHTPELYEGKTFGTLEEGVAHAEEVGFETIIERGRVVADSLPMGLVYAGMSLGVLPAQMLVQTRPGAKGAVLISSCVPPSEFGSWPAGVPAQIHMMEDDPIVVNEGDLDAARQLTNTVNGVELFLYPGTGHYFADSSHADYDKSATTLLKQRMLAFLQNLD